MCDTVSSFISSEMFAKSFLCESELCVMFTTGSFRKNRSLKKTLATIFLSIMYLWCNEINNNPQSSILRFVSRVCIYKWNIVDFVCFLDYLETRTHGRIDKCMCIKKIVDMIMLLFSIGTTIENSERSTLFLDKFRSVTMDEE